jgi:hypothetical protein
MGDSMAINNSKVLVGGLAAGVVSNIVGFVGFGLLLGPRMEAEAIAVAPALQGRGMSSGAITMNVVSSFIVAILLVWLYAAMRPRFGPGPKTAVYAALVVWLCGFLFHIDLLITGMTTTGTYALAAIVAAIQLVLTAWVGAMLYKEDVATT